MRGGGGMHYFSFTEYKITYCTNVYYGERLWRKILLKAFKPRSVECYCSGHRNACCVTSIWHSLVLFHPLFPSSSCKFRSNKGEWKTKCSRISLFWFPFTFFISKCCPLFVLFLTFSLIVFSSCFLVSFTLNYHYLMHNVLYVRYSVTFMIISHKIRSGTFRSWIHLGCWNKISLKSWFEAMQCLQTFLY
jgi:hypothetical protein